ncbi:MAG: hypothetical protein EOM40_17580 [Clostridia bacterium]|nr:hypothetical protein [Clostridia bacterium]
MKLADHKQNMRKYKKEYDSAKKKTLTKTNKLSKTAKTGLIIGAAIFSLILFVVIIVFAEPIKDMIKQGNLRKNREEIAARIEEYADQGEYDQLVDYCDSYEIMEEKGTFADYFPVMWSAFYYKNIEFYIGLFSSPEEPDMSVLDNMSDSLAEFYYASYLEQYTYIEGAVNEKNEQMLSQMRERMGDRLKDNFHVTKEDLEAFPEMTSARLKRVIEERYLGYEE